MRRIGIDRTRRLRLTAAVAGNVATVFPRSRTINRCAGISLHEIGRKREARAYLERALAICPEDRAIVRPWADSIVSTQGRLEHAALEYTARCRRLGRDTEIVVAPVRTVREWASKSGVSLLEAGEIEQVPFRAPHVWGCPPSAEIAFSPSNKPYVAEVKDARIFSNSSLILTSDGTVLSDTGGHPKFGHFVNFEYEPVVLAQEPKRLLLYFGEFKSRDVDAGIFLSGLESRAFGHWLPEFLPKLQFLQQHPDFADLPLIVDADMPQSHFDHLRRLCDNPLIKIQAGETLRCKRLLVAPSPTFLPVHIFPHEFQPHELPGLSPRALRFVRADDAIETKTKRGRRIFLARKNMHWRRLLNEDEIVSDLLKLGFETVFAEQMSVADQIEMFRQSEWIVAPNGSAMLNLIFAHTSTKLLVLSQPNLTNWGTFQGPMDHLGYQTLFVCGESSMTEGLRHSDYHVPVRRIRDALSSLGMSEVV